MDENTTFGGELYRRGDGGWTCELVRDGVVKHGRGRRYDKEGEDRGPIAAETSGMSWDILRETDETQRQGQTAPRPTR